MSEAMLEHVNLTVRDAMGTADRLCALFGWTIRWQGASINDGYSVHVGGEASYLALYSPPSTPSTDGPESYYQMGGLNHIGITVDDLDAAEARISELEGTGTDDFEQRLVLTSIGLIANERPDQAARVYSHFAGDSPPAFRLSDGWNCECGERNASLQVECITCGEQQPSPKPRSQPITPSTQQTDIKSPSTTASSVPPAATSTR